MLKNGMTREKELVFQNCRKGWAAFSQKSGVIGRLLSRGNVKGKLTELCRGKDPGRVR